jgi:hypothetical protein
MVGVRVDCEINSIPARAVQGAGLEPNRRNGEEMSVDVRQNLADVQNENHQFVVCHKVTTDWLILQQWCPGRGSKALRDARPSAEFLNPPIWLTPAIETHWFKKCIQARRAHEGARAGIRKNSRRWTIEVLPRPAAVFQIPCVKERKFDTNHDGDFGAPATVGLGL